MEQRLPCLDLYQSDLQQGPVVAPEAWLHMTRPPQEDIHRILLLGARTDHYQQVPHSVFLSQLAELARRSIWLDPISRDDLLHRDRKELAEFLFQHVGQPVQRFIRQGGRGIRSCGIGDHHETGPDWPLLRQGRGRGGLAQRLLSHIVSQTTGWSCRGAGSEYCNSYQESNGL